VITSSVTGLITHLFALFMSRGLNTAVDMTIAGVTFNASGILEIVISVSVVLIYASLLGVLFFAVLVMFFSKL